MAKTIKISKDAMDKLHKGKEISIDDITVVFDVNEEKIEIDDETKFVIDLKHLLDKHIMKEGSCGYNRSMEGKKLTTPGGLKETIEFVMENNPGITKEELKKEVKEIKRLGLEEAYEIIEVVEEGKKKKKKKSKLCKRGKDYIAARKRAGEKSSAYLSGRAVKVCKGQIKGAGGKRKKSYKGKK